MTPFAALVGSSAVPISVGNFLQIQCQFGLDVDTTISVRALVLAADGTVSKYQQTYTLLAANTTSVNRVPLENGLLLNATVSADDQGLLTGMLFARIGLLFNLPNKTENVQPLTAGYIAEGQFLSFPLSPPQSVEEETSRQHLVSTANPAAGAEITTQILPADYISLTGFTHTFTASATVAARRITYAYEVLGVIIAHVRTQTDITAGQAWTIIGWRGSGMPADDSIGRLMYVPIPDAMQGTAMSVSTATVNLQAGDQFTSLFWLVSRSVGF